MDPFAFLASGVFLDSMMPLEAEERIRRVRVDAGEVLKGIRFLSTPGHSIDHSALYGITLLGRDEVGGDLRAGWT